MTKLQRLKNLSMVAWLESSIPEWIMNKHRFTVLICPKKHVNSVMGSVGLFVKCRNTFINIMAIEQSFFNRVNRTINCFNCTLIVFLMHISFVLCYRFKGLRALGSNEWSEMCGLWMRLRWRQDFLSTHTFANGCNIMCNCGYGWPDNDVLF